MSGRTLTRDYRFTERTSLMLTITSKQLTFQDTDL